MKILIVDDHAVVRQGYASVLQVMLKGCEVIEAASGEAALSYDLSVFDLVILDVSLVGITGIETAKRMISKVPSVKILFFSMHDETPVVQQALDTGALGYITKSNSPDILMEAVRKIKAGHVYVEHELAIRLAVRRPNANEKANSPIEEMTQREFEVFMMLARGMSVRMAAEKLSLSAKTVSNYAAMLKSKLNVASNAEFVHLAMEFGLLKAFNEEKD
ncbi:MAG: response regulator [Pontibacterium sp.]